MRTGCLFSGYGGLSMGVNAYFGATTAWFSEFDTAPSRILAHHWPDTPNHGDIARIDWAAVEPIDVLTGGYPCQPFSAAGRRQGTNDDRHLWPYVREAIRHLRPRLVVLENVAGHRSMGFDRVLGDMAEDGMHVRWTSVRASDVGAPHHRERLFILATPADAACDSGRVGDGDCEYASDSDGVRGKDWGHGSGALPQLAGTGGGDVPLPHTPHDGRERGRQARHGRPGSTDNSGGRVPDAECGGRVGRETQLSRSPVIATGNGSGTDRIEWGPYAAAVRRWERLTRPAPAPAPTEPNTKGKPRLNAAFAEWMMGLPAGHVTDPAIGISRGSQLKAIGNGVCPQQAYAALCALLTMSTEAA